MNQTFIAIITFCLISIGISYLFHKKVKKYIFACLFAAIISSLIYQLIGFLVLGYLDPFFLIAFIGGAAIAFVIAMLTGIPFVCKRKE